MVDAVATSEAGIENTSPQTTSEPTINTSVSPAGNAFNNTFRKNRCGLAPMPVRIPVPQW